MKLIKAKSKNRFTGGEPFITLPRGTKVGEGESGGETDLTLPEADYYVDVSSVINIAADNPEDKGDFTSLHTTYDAYLQYDTWAGNFTSQGKNVTLKAGFPYLLEDFSEERPKVCFIGKFNNFGEDSYYRYCVCYPLDTYNMSGGYTGLVTKIDATKEYYLSGKIE